MNRFYFITAVLCILFSYNSYSYTKVIAVYDSSEAHAFTIQVGDTVKWVWSGGKHNTKSYAGPTGYSPWSYNLSAANPVFTYVPTIAGVYKFGCSDSFHYYIHGQNEMRVKPVGSCNPFFYIDVSCRYNVLCYNEFDSYTVTTNQSGIKYNWEIISPAPNPFLQYSFAPDSSSLWITPSVANVNSVQVNLNIKNSSGGCAEPFTFYVVATTYGNHGSYSNMGARTYQFNHQSDAYELAIWDYGDGSSDTMYSHGWGSPQVSKLHTYATDGIYTVGYRQRIYSAGLMCGYVTTYSLPVALGIYNSPADPFVQLFPNPATNTLKLNFRNRIDNAVLRVIDMMGREVVQYSITNSQSQLVDITAMPDGIYSLLINYGNEIFRQQFLVKK